MYSKPCIPQESSVLSAKAKLQNVQLWKRFHEKTTEMIITKVGRRIFPVLKVELCDLDPNELYFVCLEMEPVDHYRYKFTMDSADSNSRWTTCGVEETPHAGVYIHPDSPSTGEQWMSQIVNFEKCKLTNSTTPIAGSLCLTSMHKYVPKVILVQAGNVANLQWSPSITFSFPETEFIAVTAYQNNMITSLKIDHNPFAKGFRENGKSKFKRRKIEECARSLLEQQQMSPPYSDSDSSFPSSPTSPETTREAPVLPPNSYSVLMKTFPYLVKNLYDHPYDTRAYYPYLSYPPVFSSYPIIPYSYSNYPVLESNKCPNNNYEQHTEKVKHFKKMTDFSIRRLIEKS